MIKKIQRRIFNHPLYIQLLKWMYKVQLGKDKIPLILVVETALRKIQRDSLPERARSMAFSFTLSIFPAILFLFTLIPYLPIPNLDDLVLAEVRRLAPAGMYGTMEETLLEILKRPQSGLLSFGFLFTLYAASNGINAMIESFNSIYKEHDRRTIFSRLGISLSIMVVQVGALIGTIAFQIVGRIVIHHIGSGTFLESLALTVLQYIGPVLLFFLSISIVYYLAPAVQTRWHFFSVGALLASILSMLFTYAFILYFDYFSSYNKLYGSIGALIGLMMWLYSLSLIILFGYEINASMGIAKRIQRQKQA
jgi:membrane protein